MAPGQFKILGKHNMLFIKNQYRTIIGHVNNLYL